MPMGKNAAHGEGCSCEKHSSFGKAILMTLVGILVVYLIFYFGSLINNNIKKFSYIGQADKMERIITVNGTGKVTGNNDIAVTTIGYSNTDKDIAKAQTDNSKVMDQVVADLKKMGIADKDLQSNYSIYPDYNYTTSGQSVLLGYKVDNQETVKIRDLSKITAVLALAGKYGATEINGLSFTIDDPENLQSQAKDKAIADAELKAQKLAQELGVTLGGVTSFYEDNTNYSPVDYTMKAMSNVGGGIATAAPATISSGSRDIVSNVTINYEILP